MILHTTSGGNPLNFRVTGGTSPPENPRENTIWVNTGIPISSWAFRVDVPENPVEGMVHFTTAARAAAGFDALKKNEVYVYPTGCTQYVGGAWKYREFEIFKNGDWYRPQLILYDEGIFHSLTGGDLTQTGVNLYQGIENETPNHGAGTCRITKNSTSFSVSSIGARCAIAHFPNKISLENFTTLYIDGTLIEDIGFTQVGIWSSIDPAGANLNRAAYLEGPCSGLLALNVSALNGSYYIGFLVSGFSDYNVITVNKVYVE